MVELYLRKLPDEDGEPFTHPELGDMEEDQFVEWCETVRAYVGDDGYAEWFAKCKIEWSEARAISANRGKGQQPVTGN